MYPSIKSAKFSIGCLVAFLLIILHLSAGVAQPISTPPLWEVYQRSLVQAKYVDLTHTINPSIPVWAGFGKSTFEPTINPKTGKPYIYENDGFEATHYNLSTDQLGTQLDPPAHWEPNYPAIDELPRKWV